MRRSRRAARHVIDGASFDNNLLCIGEKELFVAEEVADDFMAALRRAGAVALDARQIDALTKAAFTFDGDGAGCARAHVKRDFVGKDAVRPRRGGRDAGSCDDAAPLRRNGRGSSPSFRKSR